MPRVVILAHKPGAPPLEADALEGGRFLDFCDAHDAPIAFSCRDANCGTCCVDVLDGRDTLLAPERAERDVLARLAATSTHRLACCMTMKPGASLLRVRALRRADD